MPGLAPLLSDPVKMCVRIATNTERRSATDGIQTQNSPARERLVAKRSEVLRSRVSFRFGRARISALFLCRNMQCQCTNSCQRRAPARNRGGLASCARSWQLFICTPNDPLRERWLLLFFIFYFFYFLIFSFSCFYFYFFVFPYPPGGRVDNVGLCRWAGDGDAHPLSDSSIHRSGWMGAAVFIPLFSREFIVSGFLKVVMFDNTSASDAYDLQVCRLVQLFSSKEPESPPLPPPVPPPAQMRM